MHVKPFHLTAIIAGITSVFAKGENEVNGEGVNRRKSGGCTSATKPNDMTKYTEAALDLSVFKEKLSARVLSRRMPGSVDVNVYSHVIMDRKGNGNITDAVIEKQIAVLNDAFGGVDERTCSDESHTCTSNTSFRFSTAGISRTTKNGWYTAAPGSSQEISMKKALHTGSCADLNVYFIKAPGGLLGWAALPWDCDGNPWDSGVVNGAGKNMDGGDTFTYEVGHWLGLWNASHRCGGNGDDIFDSPEPVFDCGTDTNTSFTQKNDHVDDNAKDCCMHQFTQGQSDRMEFMWNKYREEKVTPRRLRGGKSILNGQGSESS